MYWFKKHPEHFRQESSELATNPNYKELFQERDELFVSHGFIITRQGKSSRHPILIVYPEGTPYQLPYIFPLKRELSHEEVVAIAAQKNPFPPTDIVKYFYGLRHQNSSGSLCFIEWETFDEGGQFYGIKSILQRVTDWYKGHTTGEFPPDSQEVEFCAHFNNVSKNFRLVYPLQFVENSNVQGEFYITQQLKIPKELFQEPLGLPYIGTYITGVTKGGIAIESSGELNVPEWIKEEGLATAIDFETKPDLLKRLFDEGRLKAGIWFSIDNEPTPFRHFTDLLAIIGNGSTDVGIQRLHAIAYNKVKVLPDELLIAIRFPNRRGEQEFQAFTVNKKANPNGLLLSGSELETLKDALSKYGNISAVICEKFSEELFFQRNASRADRSLLKEQSVTLLGVGALGGEISDCLAKAGIGNMCLVDNQVMSVQNIMRHVAGLEDVGKAKVNAVAELLHNHNPFLRDIIKVTEDITKSGVFNELPSESLFFSSIADDNIEGYINEMAVEAGRIVFYVRALRGGKAARIVRVIPGQDACLNCLGLYRRDKGNTVQIPSDPSLPTLRNECNNPVLPASAADLKLIASLASRIAIDFLQEEVKDSNHWIWTTEEIPETIFKEPFKLHSQTLSPHPNCQICNSGINAAVNIAPEVLEALKEKVINKAGRETGGVLAGYRNEEGEIFITHASDAGPKAIELPTRFEKDIEFCQQFLNDLLQQYGDKAIYLGEWHSHPNENNKPSSTDISSLSAISQQKEYLTDKPVMLIFTKSGNPSCTVHPAGKLHSHVALHIIP